MAISYCVYGRRIHKNHKMRGKYSFRTKRTKKTKPFCSELPSAAEKSVSVFLLLHPVVFIALKISWVPLNDPSWGPSISRTGPPLRKLLPSAIFIVHIFSSHIDRARCFSLVHNLFLRFRSGVVFLADFLGERQKTVSWSQASPLPVNSVQIQRSCNQISGIHPRLCHIFTCHDDTTMQHLRVVALFRFGRLTVGSLLLFLYQDELLVLFLFSMRGAYFMILDGMIVMEQTGLVRLFM